MSLVQRSGAAADLPDSAPNALDTWPTVVKSFRTPDVPVPDPWERLFGGIRTGSVDNLVVVGQIGQSLDGRTATPSGHSHYINGVAGLDHLHRLRALVDAVVVGVGTAVADDPQLTVRRVAGPNPARIVIDPAGRLPSTARVLNNDGARRIVVTAMDARSALPPDVELVRLRPTGGQIAPSDILSSLATCGLRRMLIEGGANTVSRFLAAHCLDRLHIVVAPVIFGSGQVGLTLPPIERADHALRPPIHVHRLGEDVLFDCDLSGQRFAIGRAKKST